MRKFVGSFMICLAILSGTNYFMVIRSEQQTQMTIQEIRQFMGKKDKVVKSLLFIAKQESKSNPVRAAWAINMLGELKAIEAINFLLDNIAFQNPYVDEPIDLYPAVVALKMIGYPSIKAIIYEGFKQERSDIEQRLMAMVIKEVLGPREIGTRLGRLVIQEHLHSAQLPSLIRERLVKFMEKHFPERKPTKRR